MISGDFYNLMQAFKENPTETTLYIVGTILILVVIVFIADKLEKWYKKRKKYEEN
jgi:hypothetical protein